MKVIALAFASVLLVSPAFAQSIPTIGPALFNPINVSNVPLIVSGVGSANQAAGITILDSNTVSHIPALASSASLAAGIGNFLVITRPLP